MALGNCYDKIKIVKELSKSGIVTLVLISVLAGYLIGQSPELPFQFARAVWTLVGVLFLASGSSALNQIQEREIDSQMPRTAGRPLPSGRISLRTAILFVGVSLVIGIGILGALSPMLLILGGLAVFSYNILYTLWWKKNWAFGAVPGAVPGAIPILIGYASASGQIFAPAGIFLFAILFFWQMPHFWALAIRYQKDYEKGGFPTLPVRHGSKKTVHHIVIWCLCYLGLALMGPLFLKVGWIYLAPTVIVCLKVGYELFRFTRNPESKRWLHFFLWVNFSLILFLTAAVIDLWEYPWFFWIQI